LRFTGVAEHPGAFQSDPRFHRANVIIDDEIIVAHMGYNVKPIWAFFFLFSQGPNGLAVVAQPG
jgi:hypothetical protein